MVGRRQRAGRVGCGARGARAYLSSLLGRVAWGVQHEQRGAVPDEAKNVLGAEIPAETPKMTASLRKDGILDAL